MRKLVVIVLMFFVFNAAANESMFTISSVSLEDIQHLSSYHKYKNLRGLVIFKDKLIDTEKDPELLSALYTAEETGRAIDVYYGTTIEDRVYYKQYSYKQLIRKIVLK